MGLPMKRHSDHPDIPAIWAAPEDTGDCRFPSSPVTLPPLRHGSRDCRTKPRCHPEPVERVTLSPTHAVNSSPSALPANRAPFVTNPRLIRTGWIWLDLLECTTRQRPREPSRSAHRMEAGASIYLDSPPVTQAFIQTPSRPSFPSFQTSILNLCVFAPFRFVNSNSASCLCAFV